MEVEFTCRKHPKYNGMRRPIKCCVRCDDIYELKKALGLNKNSYHVVYDKKAAELAELARLSKIFGTPVVTATQKNYGSQTR